MVVVMLWRRAPVGFGHAPTSHDQDYYEHHESRRQVIYHADRIN
jgi:hypothetical protein